MAGVRVNGVGLFYETVGAGDPLVLEHGSWGDHHNWQGPPRVEHTFARMKSWKILRESLLRGDDVHHAMSDSTSG
ncbi:alpha/beta fold hydrolase [Streptomyces sp. NPDC091290]|uniref:alpha/beta fold hydrolase n=1 Tax=Streptomyces sp. NPDC091290 TaxID=3365990 RepID=UPI0038134755